MVFNKLHRGIKDKGIVLKITDVGLFSLLALLGILGFLLLRAFGALLRATLVGIMSLLFTLKALNVLSILRSVGAR